MDDCDSLAPQCGHHERIKRPLVYSDSAQRNPAAIKGALNHIFLNLTIYREKSEKLWL